MFIQHQIINAAKERSRIAIWHNRYGYLNVASLKKLANEQLVNGLNQDDVSDEMIFCESCVQGKIHRTPFPTVGGKRAEVPLGLVHSDVCVKIN